MYTKSEKPWYLKKQNFFSSLSDSQREDMKKMAMVRQIEKNEIICHLDDDCQYISILKNGIAKVFLLNSEGSEVILAIRHSGDIIGMTAIFGWPKRVSYVSALQKVEVYNIKTAVMKKYIMDNPDVAILIIKVLGARLHYSRMTIEDLATRNVEHRLVRLILHFLADLGEETNQGIEIPLRLTHEQIAQLIASSRQTVSSMIKDLEREGLIRKYRDRIIVLDQDTLYDMLV